MTPANSNGNKLPLILWFALLLFLSGCIKHSSLPQTMAEAPPEQNFTLVVVPDTQYYSKRYPAIYFRQMRWIAANRDRLNMSIGMQK